ncbi:MAG TPA: phage tail tape measure C-terminal domain-containing protein [Candidatus Angelobacter sp.]|nr:phage tail tape measure C-terminal domain-containing protein [Candidatus Angelobacter sp.]
MPDNEVAVKITGDASSLKAATDTAKEQLEKAGASVETLGDLIGIKIPGAIKDMIASSELLGPALDVAFAPLAVIALGQAISDATEKAREHREELERLGREALQAGNDIQQWGESLRISNLRLEDQIRTIQKQPAQNGPKIAFIEASQEADKLTASIQKAIEADNKLLQAQAQSALSRIVFGSNQQQAIANEIAVRYAAFQEELNQLDEQTRRDELDNQKEVTNDRNKYNAKLDALRQYLRQVQSDVDTARNQDVTELQKNQDISNLSTGDSESIPGLGKPEAIAQATRDYSELQNVVTTLRGTLSAASTAAKELKDNISLKADKDQAQAQAEAQEFFDDALHRRNKIVVAKQQQNKETTTEVSLEQALAAAGAAELRNAQQRAAIAEKQAANTARIDQLQRDIADKQAEHSAALAIALGYTTQEKSDAQALATLEKNKSTALDEANNRLTAQIAIVKNLGAATMNGMLGSPEQKAAFQKAVLEYQQLKIEELNLEKKYDDQIAALQLKLANTFSAQFRKQLLSWQEINKELGQTFETTLNGLNSSLASFVTTGTANWKQLASSAIEQIINIGLQYEESQLMMAIMGKGAAKTQTQTKAQSGVAQIEVDSHVAAANAYAPWAAFPPIAASMATAAEGIVHAFAAPVIALAGASAEGGQYLVPGPQLTMLHPQEMVLPAGIATQMRSVIAGGGGGGITVVVNHSVNAVDAESFQGQIRRHSNMIGNEVARVLKRKGFAPAK